MELTGRRRFIHAALFATVAWAGYLILFAWSWDGAGNGASVVLALAAVVFTTRAIQRPTLEQARRASWLLVALLPTAACELALSIPHGLWFYTPGIAVRTAVLVITASAAVLPAVVEMLARSERKARAAVFAQSFY